MIRQNSQVCRSCAPVRRAHAAMTVVELLIATALSGVVLSAAGTILLQSLKNDLAFRRQMNAQQNARAAADMVADDLRGAVRFTSLMTVNGLQRAVPTDTVTNTLAINSMGSIDDYTHPLTFDVYPESGSTTTTRRRIRYWRRFNSTTQTYELRREIVDDVLNSTGGRTASESASSASGGKMVARDVTRFTVTEQSLGGGVTYDIACIFIEVTDGTATASVQANVTLRNNTVSAL